MLCKLFSVLLICCLFLSCAGTAGAAAEDDLIVDLDFQAAAVGTDNIGLTNKQAADVTILGKNVSVGSYTSFSGEKRYVTVPLSGTNAGDKHLSVESAALANQSMTAEAWVKFPSALTAWGGLIGIFGQKTDGTWLSAASSQYAGRSAWFSVTMASGQIAAGNAGGGTSKNYTAPMAPGEWIHVALVRDMVCTENETGQTQDVSVKTSLYLNGVLQSSLVTEGSAAAVEKEEKAVIVIGSRLFTGYDMGSISVASLKAYKGALDTETVAAHYEAELDAFMEAASPSVAEISPAEGAEIDAHSAEWTLKFQTALSESSLAEGIVIKNSDGQTITQDALTLSEDKKTVSVSAYGLEEGEYTVEVTEAVRSESGGMPANPASYRYRAKRMNLSADFSDLNIWGDWLVGEERTSEDLQAKADWLYGVDEVSEPYGISKFLLSEDGGLIFRWNSLASLSSCYQSQMFIRPETPVYKGAVVYDLKMKHGPEYSPSSRQCLLIMGSTGKQLNTVEVMRGVLRSGANTAESYSDAKTDEDGYYALRYVIKSEALTDDWTYTIYNEDREIVSGVLERAEYGNIAGLRVYNFGTSSADAYNDISLKDIRVEYIKQDLTVTAGDFEENTKSLPLRFCAVPAGLTAEQVTVTHANGAVIPTAVQAGESAAEYILSFPYGLPFAGDYTVSFSKLCYPNSVIYFHDTVSFAVGSASETALYNIALTDWYNEAVTVLDEVTNLTFSYEATGYEDAALFMACYGDEHRLLNVKCALLKEQGELTLPIGYGTKQVKILVFDDGSLRPLCRVQSIGYSDEYEAEPAPLLISGGFYNGDGSLITHMEEQSGITANARLSAGEPPKNLTAALKVIRGTSETVTDSVQITFDDKGTASVLLPLTGSVQSGDVLCFYITDGDAVYFSKTIPYENQAKIVDILLVAGQSNALGQGGNASESLKPKAGTVYYNTMGNTLLSDSGNQGWDSALGKTWHEETGRTVLIVKATWGGTGFPTMLDLSTGVSSPYGSSAFGYWNPDNEGSTTAAPYDCYTLAKERYAAAVASVDTSKYTIGRCIYFWNQGENESNSYTPQMYKEAFLELHEKFTSEFGTEETRLTHGGILPVRSSYSLGFPNLELTGPRVAQYHMGTESGDLKIVMDATEHWYSDDAIKSWFRDAYYGEDYPGTAMPDAWTDIMNTDNVHYKQLAMNEFGIEAAKNMLAFLEGGREADGIDLITPSGIQHYSDGDSIYLTTDSVIPVLPASSGRKGTFSISGAAASLDSYGVLTAQAALQNDYATLTVEVPEQEPMTFKVYSPIADNSISIAAIQGNKDAIYTLTTDDNLAQTHVYLDSKLRELGLKGTMGIITDTMDSSGKMTWEQAEGYVENGDTWGVANHTKSHMDISGFTADELEPEINTARAVLREHFPTEKVVGLYTPFGHSNATIISKVAEEHLCLCLAGGGANSLPMTEDAMYGLKRYAIGYFATSDPAKMNGWVDTAIASNQWMVEMWHGIGDTDAASWNGNISEEIAAEHLQYVAQKNDEGKLWVTTLDEACVYAMQRLKVRLSLVSKTDTSITFRMTDDLDDTLYDAALTVNVALPDGWTDAAARQNGQVLPSTVENGVLSVTVLADSGDITVSE